MRGSVGLQIVQKKKKKKKFFVKATFEAKIA